MKVFSRTLCAMTVIAASFGCLRRHHHQRYARGVPAYQREVSPSMVNDGKQARLVQAWVDGGDASERAESSKAPFLITPPMSARPSRQGPDVAHHVYRRGTSAAGP